MPLAQSGRLPLLTSMAFRLVLTTAALVLWFWTQSLIGARGVPASGIEDRVHAVTAPANLYLHHHPAGANALLVVSSGMVDLLGIFLLSMWIFRSDPRPFVGLVIVLGLRQIMQACVLLPAPPDAIWHYPGFPSLLVTYGVAYDYFFSGHTAIAVLAATELARAGKRWITMGAVGIVLFEAAAVLILRAHYTMDVFTGLVTGLYAAHLAEHIAASIQRRGRGQGFRSEG
jgi:PAP2 superfamily C-terminal